MNGKTYLRILEEITGGFYNRLHIQVQNLNLKPDTKLIFLVTPAIYTQNG
ncbi:hypothetical protein NIES806_45080 [Dolichospermum compactum NIES-806]|jgi:hypothetical protein|uniref:Uncharacterized protein n=1 Tax=Dolichospermum compactum NIES-806 TaxID=1973481 RepID=A0A1Z4V9L5_9CYAN|nr:hypothetical protein NIES806_45080 [Dolichospermum compactum NIES-806]